MANVSINKQRSLVDEPISIQLSGLPSSSQITMKLNIRETYGSFSAFGHYLSDSNGHLDLTSSNCIDGTYTGIDGMGLFWSLQQDPSKKPGLRLLRRDAEIPLRYQLTALTGHVTWEELTASSSGQSENAVLCTANLERSYLADSVERIPIRIGRLRGSLFKPRSGTSWPPVIDLFGTGGGLMEHRAALLAKEGFSVLSLAYFNYDDLPKDFQAIDMDYFEEAIDFMLASPYSTTHGSINTGGVALIGTSSGADIVASAGILFGDKVRAVVWLNGSFCHSWTPIRHRKSNRGLRLPAQIPLDISLVKTSPRPPSLDFRAACCPGCTREMELPVEQSGCRWLFISCLDDYSTDPQSGTVLADRLRRAGRTDFEHVTYPDAGHLLEPPITPCSPLCYHGVYKVVMDYGGKPLHHHLAQVDAWARIIRFLRQSCCYDQQPAVAKL